MIRQKREWDWRRVKFHYKMSSEKTVEWSLDDRIVLGIRRIPTACLRPVVTEVGIFTIFSVMIMVTTDNDSYIWYSSLQDRHHLYRTGMLGALWRGRIVAVSHKRIISKWRGVGIDFFRYFNFGNFPCQKSSVNFSLSFYCTKTFSTTKVNSSFWNYTNIVSKHSMLSRLLTRGAFRSVWLNSDRNV